MMNTHKKQNLHRLILSALLMAVAMVLPFFTAQLKALGSAFLPMHFPIMLCGFLCGAKYGFAIGFIAPLLRGAIFGMPPLYPNAVWQAFELAVYGFVCGYMYFRLGEPKLWKTYISLITAMLSGRVVWGIIKAVVLGFGGEAFTVQMFVAGGILNAIPGIVLQLILIPPVVTVIKKRFSYQM